MKVDCYACCGIDQLTEKVPQLKDATPKLIEETKVWIFTICLCSLFQNYFFRTP